MYYLDPKYEKWYYDNTGNMMLFDLDKPIEIVKWGVFKSHVKQGGTVGCEGVPSQFIIKKYAGNNKA